MYKTIKIYGFKYAFKKLSLILTGNFKSLDEEGYSAWIKTNEPNEEELEKQRKHKFKISPKISIVVPMYNTKWDFLKN